MGKVAVITGGSSGIGQQAARMFAKKGFSVFDLSRGGKGEEGVAHIPCDVSDKTSVKAAIEAVHTAAGRIDVLVLNAGMGISGPVELTEEAAARKIFDVNFFGTLFCVQAALPYLRESRGTVVCVSSVAAPMAIPFQAFYSCTKAAVNDLVLALRIELRPFGVKACAVMPGDARTGFTAAREKAADPQNLYAGRDTRAVAVMEHDEEHGMTAEAVARYILRAAEAKRPRPFYVTGAQYRVLVFAARLLPASLVNFVIGKMYS
ncbi:MAG: SDR family NAD(P)-dependent oxidoreductase [Firmicutes bacterium]|nr:SDR family NAD(P)-dependent oxidoreductase [Bacillota bacterium]